MAESSKKNRLFEARWAKKNTLWEYEDDIYTREDWKSDVANGDTQQGYYDWLLHNLESAECNVR